MCECVLCAGTNRFHSSMVYENDNNEIKLKRNVFCGHQKEKHKIAHKLAMYVI